MSQPFSIVIECEGIETFNRTDRRTKDVLLKGVQKPGGISDGYHTFDELYDHRITLYIALCRLQANGNSCDDFNLHPVWRSKLHHDGSSFDGWFILGIGKKPGEQITYHLPESRWAETEFAETLDKAPEWDTHISSDVLARLKAL